MLCETQALNNPPPLLRFLFDSGRMLCDFFRRCVSEIPLIVLAFLYSSTLLRFFCAKGFLGRTVVQEWGGGIPGFFYEKCYIFARKTPRQKVLFFLAL